ncbi:MAG: metallophosphatase [Bacteroidota bacterium]
MKSRKHILFILLATIILMGNSVPAFNHNLDKKLKKITILFTNDTHSRIEPFASNDKKFANLGGYARRAAMVKQIRNEEKNVMLFDAGDVFQGTPYYNFYHGQLEYNLMSLMGYTAVNLGNHEFDEGLEGLFNLYPLAKFDILSANYDFSETILKDKIKPYEIYTVDGIKVGVFGLGVALKGLVSTTNYGKTKCLNPLEKAAEIAYLLKKTAHCDLVICLSHLGFSYQDDQISDMVLAKQSKNIDLIIGGHTHTFLDKPCVVKNSDKEEVIITQLGFGGTRLGRIDFYFTKNTVVKIAEIDAKNK